MKAFSLIILLVVFSIISILSYYTSADKASSAGTMVNDTFSASDNKNTLHAERSTIYIADAKLNNIDKSINVSSSIYVHVEDPDGADTLFFILGLNDVVTTIESNNSAGQKLITFKNFEIYKTQINGNNTQLKFYDTGNSELSDSVIGFINLNDFIFDKDTIIISLDYNINIQSESSAIGYAAGREFFYVSNWLPNVILSSGTARTNGRIVDRIIERAEISDYYIDLSLPEGFRLISNGERIDSTRGNGQNIYKLSSVNTSGLSWIAAKEINYTSIDVQLTSDRTLKLNLYIQPENSRYLNRYREAAGKSINYFYDNFSCFPFESLSLVDIPQTSNSAYLTSENLITIKSEILSSRGLAEIEFYTAKLISKQFLMKAFGLNYSPNHWIVEGLSSVYANEIINQYFEAPKLSFKFASHYPVYGMNHLSFNDIPIVYSLIELEYDLGIKNLSKYYSNKTMGSITDCFYDYPSLDSYINNKHTKPYLLFKSLIEEEGIESFNQKIKAEIINYKSGNVYSKEQKFIKIIQELSSTSLDQFLNSSKYVDYSVRSVEIIDGNKYRIFAERIGDAVCSAKILLHTDDGTIEEPWTGAERFKYFTILSDENVYAAEIVLTDTKYLDINFANNSYTVENQYWGSLSLAIRVFFWFQNAIMIFGSAS